MKYALRCELDRIRKQPKTEGNGYFGCFRLKPNAFFKYVTFSVDDEKLILDASHFSILGVIHALPWAENILWTRLCLSSFPYLRGQLGHCATMGRYVIFEHIFAQVTLSHCVIMTKGTTMTSDHRATVTYVMWREEHPWNISILQRVHLLQSCLTSVSLIIPINWSREMHGKRLVRKWKHLLSYKLIFKYIRIDGKH
jgi:hypothetical protein